MFGFFVGAVSLYALWRVLRGPRHWHRWHHHRHGGGFDGDARASWAMRRLFERLDTSPGQEKVIREAFDKFRDETRDLPRDVVDARRDLGKAMRSDNFDESLLGEAFARTGGALDRLHKAVVGALGSVHEVLDERQRKILAEWIESRGGWMHGPYRGCA
jgi:hypothetical protein